MKKKSIFVFVACTLVAGAFLTSCNKDEESSSCLCTESGDGESYQQYIDPESYGKKNCSDLALYLNMMRTDGEYYYSCK